MWGLDLSGTPQGAGGVGGLLTANLGANGTHFVAFDGNGNVSTLVDASSGSVSGNLDYGPFGELLRKTGAALACPIDYSTKYRDKETGLLNYTFRILNTSTGRFLSHDPIEERGGMNVYAYCSNDPISYTDLLGLWKIERKGQHRAMAYVAEGDTIRGLASKIRLNTREWRSWLKREKVYTRPIGLDTPLTTCDSFSVPNTAYVDYSVGAVTLPLAVVMRWYSSMLQNRWRDEGYLVDFSRWRLGKDWVLAHLNDPDLYAYAYLGHGAVGKLILGLDESEWIDPGRYTPFGIVEMQLIACETYMGESEWARNVSKNGILFTVEGDVSAYQLNLRVRSGEE
jgi:RHS repeat-associated protein